MLNLSMLYSTASTFEQMRPNNEGLSLRRLVVVVVWFVLEAWRRVDVVTVSDKEFYRVGSWYYK
jgi:hypothetical protein